MKNPVVKVGSLWRDNNPRLDWSRIGKVVTISGRYAVIKWRKRGSVMTFGAQRRVLLSRFNGKSNGYSLVENA